MESTVFKPNLAFKNIITQSNIKKIILIGTVYTLIEFVGLIMSSLGYFESDIRLYVTIIVAFHLVYLPSLVIMFNTFDLVNKKQYTLIKAMEYIYYFVVCAWASVFTVLVYLDQRDITIYVIVIFLIAALFVIKPWMTRLIYGTNLLVFLSYTFYSLENKLAFNELAFKTLLVTILAGVIAESNYSMRQKLHGSKEQLLSMNETLKDRSLRDSLTHLYNNGYMFDYVDHAINHHDRCGSKFSVLMIDIDDFKTVNDRFGHLFGDQVICQVAETLKGLTRHHDVVGRYGGEEFIIALCHTQANLAKEIAERIRKEIADLRFEEDIRISVSIGIASYRGQDTMDLVKEADINLYKAKESGKNQVVA